MDEIRVMQKPDWISWDDIHELLLAAHKKNIEKGVVMNTTTMSGSELKEYIGDHGRCFVAICGDKLIGTTSVKVVVGSRWFDKGKKIAKGTMSAILKQYQGLGIFEEMNELRDRFIEENGVEMLECDTAEDNIMMRKILAKKGYKEVRFFPAGYQNHFSIFFAKWLNGCPFSDKTIRRRFYFSKFLTKTQYKPGKVERSRVLSFLCQCINRIWR